MEVDLPEAHFGANIRFRESSFLSSPNVPPSVKQSQLVIQPCEVGLSLDFCWAILPFKLQLSFVKPLKGCIYGSECMELVAGCIVRRAECGVKKN